MHVTISQLTESDSGWYWCGLNTSSQGFEIIVANGEFTQCDSFKKCQKTQILGEKIFTLKQETDDLREA